MKIKFYGGVGRVTGSCHMLVVDGKRILLDCGLFQGKDEKEIGNEEFYFNPKEIDYIILSHAHTDHSGRIPLLYKNGFKGKVVCTEGTKELCSVMLPDSGHIHEMEIEWKNRKRIRRGLKPVEPLYTSKIAELSTYLFEGYPYDEYFNLCQGVKVRFRDAGHLLGSSIIELLIKEKGKDEIKLVFTGDLGNKDIPILKNPSEIDYADYVIMESTYGNRNHEAIENELIKLVHIIKKTFQRGGNVIIPSFAVGRTQEIIYILNNYLEKDMLKDIQVFVDSPLALETTKIFKNHEEYYDEEARRFTKKGSNPFEFEGLHFTKTAQESIKVNKIESGAIVISSSGMCDAGRIKHHLKHNLWREESSIVFVGYQAEGTLGRAILNGNKKVHLFGEEVAVNAHIYSLQGLSGHADREGLLKWVEGFKKKPKKILLVHGDRPSQESFKELLCSKGYKTKIVQLGESYIINDYQVENTDLKDKITQVIESFGEVNEINKYYLLDRIKEVIEMN